MGNTNSNENREKIYNEGFYKNRNDSTVYSAKMVLELLQPYFTINSVIDFGCGVGTWLKMAKELFGKNVFDYPALHTIRYCFGSPLRLSCYEIYLQL